MMSSCDAFLWSMKHSSMLSWTCIVHQMFVRLMTHSAQVCGCVSVTVAWQLDSWLAGADCQCIQ